MPRAAPQVFEGYKEEWHAARDDLDGQIRIESGNVEGKNIGYRLRIGEGRAEGGPELAHLREGWLSSIELDGYRYHPHTFLEAGSGLGQGGIYHARPGEGESCPYGGVASHGQLFPRGKDAHLEVICRVFRG